MSKCFGESKVSRINAPAVQSQKERSSFALFEGCLGSPSSSSSSSSDKSIRTLGVGRGGASPPESSSSPACCTFAVFRGLLADGMGGGRPGPLTGTGSVLPLAALTGGTIDDPATSSSKPGNRGRCHPVPAVRLAPSRSAVWDLLSKSAMLSFQERRESPRLCVPYKLNLSKMAVRNCRMSRRPTSGVIVLATTLSYMSWRP